MRTNTSKITKLTLIPIMFFALALMASANSVMIFSFFEDTTADTISIVDGQSEGFVVSANSALESSMTVRTDIINSTGHIISTPITANTYTSSYSAAVTIGPIVYGVPGNYTIRSVVTGASGATNTSILHLNILPVIAGNNPPAFTSNPITSVNEGNLYSYQAVANDPENAQLTYSLTQAPAWLSINPSTGLVSGTAPQVSADTNYAITISVTDGTYTILQSYALTVLNGQAQTSSVLAMLLYDNTSARTLTASNGATIGFTASANSVLESSMTISVDLLDGNGVVMSNLINQLTSSNSYSAHYDLTPAAYGGIGNYTIRETVTGSSGNTSISTLSLFITGTGANNPPVITSTPIVMVNSSASYTYQVTATDADGDALTYSLVQAPAWLSINPITGLVSGTAPTVFANTQYTIIIGVTDGINPTVTQTYDLMVVFSPNGAVLATLSYNSTPATTLAIINGDAVAVNVAAASLFESSMTINVEILDSNLVVLGNLLSASTVANNYSSTITLTSLQYPGVGNYILRENVTGASGASDIAILYLQVFAANGTNQPPQITSTPITTVDEMTLYNYQIIASDADNNTLAYSLTTAPAWLSINPTTGLVSGVAPSVNADTNYNIIISVTDGTYTIQQSYTLTVINVAGPTSNVSVALSYNNTASSYLTILNGNTATVNLTSASQNENNMTINLNLLDASGNVIANLASFTTNSNSYNNQFDITSAMYSGVGNYTIIANVTGASGATSTSELSLEVINQIGTNNPPIITSAAITTATEMTAYSYQVMATDADNDSLTYSLVNAPAWLSINSTSGLVSGTAPSVNVNTDYNVTIIVTDGVYSIQQPYVLTVVNVPFTVTVSANPISGQIPLIVAFTTTVTGTGPFTYAWDFDNDGIIDSNTANPTFTYTTAGSHVARLTVTETSSGSQTMNIIVINAQPVQPAVDGEDGDEGSLKAKFSIEGIIYDEVIKAGSETEVYVNTKNVDTNKGSVTVMIRDLDVHEKNGGLSMTNNARTSSKFILQIPSDAMPGVYDLMVTVYADGQQRTKYRQIEII